MKKQMKNKKQESGRSMIEMVGVLAVMGLITAAAFVLITSAMRSQKLSRADDDIAALAAGVRLLYNNSDNFDGLTVEKASANTLKALGFDKVKPAYGSDATYAIAGATSAGAACTAANGNTASTCTNFTISFDTGDTALCGGLKERTWANGGTASCSGTTLKILFNDGK